MATPCYLLEPTDRMQWKLRRFGFGPSETEPDRYACPSREPWQDGYRPGCDASSGYLGELPLVLSPEGYLAAMDAPARDDERWPAVCAHCGEPFSHDEMWQANPEPIYRVTVALPGAALELGAETPLHDAPGGAMWYADWMPDTKYWRGPDGRALMVRLPDGHDWHVDGEANNCTRKGDLTHKCWIRAGDPPNVTAGKDGETCAAGAGSILSPGYHGFLQAGVLT